MAHRLRGASAIEFALVLPIFLVLVSGVADYGFYFMERGKALDAVRDAARLGVASPRDTDPRTVASTAALAILKGAGSPCDTGCRVDATLTSSGILQVLDLRITRDFEPRLGIVPVPPTLVADHMMALEHQDLAFYGL